MSVVHNLSTVVNVATAQLLLINVTISQLLWM